MYVQIWTHDCPSQAWWIYYCFVMCLQSLTQHCVYKDEFIAEMVRDAFMFSINNVQIQRQLFQRKDKFSLLAAINMAIMIKLSSKDASALHNHKPQQSVTPDKSQFSKSKTEVSCYPCVGSHLATQCGFHQTECMHVAKWATLPECVIVKLPIIHSTSLRSLYKCLL